MIFMLLAAGWFLIFAGGREKVSVSRLQDNLGLEED